MQSWPVLDMSQPFCQEGGLASFPPWQCCCSSVQRVSFTGGRPEVPTHLIMEGKRSLTAQPITSQRAMALLSLVLGGKLTLKGQTRKIHPSTSPPRAQELRCITCQPQVEGTLGTIHEMTKVIGYGTPEVAFPAHADTVTQHTSVSSVRASYKQRCCELPEVSSPTPWSTMGEQSPSADEKDR